MSFLFFENVLSELNYKLTFDAVANYAGNGFCEKSWDLICEHHPMWVGSKEKSQGDNGALQQLANLFGGFGPSTPKK